MIQNFGGGELLVIIILALVVLGPERIPEMAKGAGRLIAKFKNMTSGLQGQVQGVMDDPAMQPLKELGDFAARPRQKLAEYALEAEADERAKAEQASIDAAAANGSAATGSDGDAAPAAASPAAATPDASPAAASADASPAAAPTDATPADAPAPAGGDDVTAPAAEVPVAPEERETA
ncbi:Sec-independent protein translocase subunit TatA/TatB [Dermatobacter hominis]|uniref:Sec-independent protein translocase subunit TatA/TatB n=1 Tax=Dermatobacter hominis TaxID=2884263 RepID=UPI001D0F64D4|nr:twin-arginine translocase TatA/TatE family subunit [Dermatobacter hominis]UDY36382.1 twin-arginine translocase TatA/TatE family subunit [Dermatobacter hominis]